MKFKILLFSLLLFVCVKNISAQMYDWVWTKAAGGSDYDRGYCIAIDVAGNEYITGHFQSQTMTIGNDTLKCAGQYDFFIAKYDANGNPLWAKTAFDAGNDKGGAITVDNAGNILVTGYFYGATIVFGNDTLINAGAGNGDGFIAKYDPNGNVLWATSIGGTGTDWANAVATDAAGNIYASGAYESATMTIGSTTLTNANPGYDNIFLAKFDVNGNPAWALSAGGTYWETGTGVVVDGSGNVYMTGYFYSSSITFGSTTLTGTGGYDVFLAKFDSSGNSIWAKSAIGKTSEISTGIAIDGSANIFISGSYYSDSLTFDTVMLRNTGAYDIFVTKYDSAGDVLWGKGFATSDSGSDEGKRIATDANRNVYLTGDFTGTGLAIGSFILNNPNTSTRDLYIAKFDPNGNVLWATNAGALTNEYGEDIKVDAGGNTIYLTGSFNSDTVAFGKDTLFNKDLVSNTTDYFISKLKFRDVKVGNPPSENSSFIVYPNPSNGFINIFPFKTFGGGELNIYDVLGTNIFSEKITGKQKTLNCKLSPGVYFVQLRDEKNIMTKKIVVE